MSKWVKLKSIADLTVGFVGTMAKHYEDNGIPFLRSLNIKPFKIVNDDMKYISQEFCEKISKSILREGDVVIVRTGLPGTCCVVPAEYDGCNCSDVVIVHPNTELVNAHYLAAFINIWGQRQIHNNKVGAIQQHFNVRSAEEMLIYLPEKEEQEKIAGVVIAINEKIESNNTICSELEAMAKTIYDYWFVQFNFPDKNGKPYRTSGGEMVWNEQLKREIPKGWEATRLGNICDFRNGINYDKDVEGDQEYRIINVRNISSASLLLNESELDKINLPSVQADKYLLSSDDIVIARSGTPGATRLLWKINEPTIFCGFIICSTPHEALHKIYLTYCLKRLEGTSATKTGGSILQNVSQDTLKNLFVLIPDREVLRQFNAVISLILEKFHSNIDENNELTKLRDWLLPMLMNGQARVE